MNQSEERHRQGSALPAVVGIYGDAFLILLFVYVVMPLMHWQFSWETSAGRNAYRIFLASAFVLPFVLGGLTSILIKAKRRRQTS